MSRALSVIMPVYNGARYLAPAIESILSQTYRDFELVILDDGSTDATPQILARFAASDPRIRVLTRPRQGQIASRNELLREAHSEIVACPGADDISLPDRLEGQACWVGRADRFRLLDGATLSEHVQPGAAAEMGLPTELNSIVRMTAKIS